MPRSNTYSNREIGYSIVFNFLSKIVGFGTTLIVALKIGTTLELDLYYLATGLIGVISGIIVAQESYLIIPKGLLIKSKLGLQPFMKFYNGVLLIYFIVLVFLAIVFVLFTTQIFSLSSKYSINQINESKYILKILVIYLIFNPINTLMGNILNSLNYFSISTFVTFISSVLIIASLIFFGELGTFSLYVGVCLSSIATFVYYILYLKFKGWIFSFYIWNVRMKFDSNLIYANSMAFLAYFKGLLNNYVISGMGKGVLTGFNFGYGLHNLPNFLILSQVKVPFSVKISELYHEKKLLELNEYISSIILFLIILTVPVNLLIFGFSDQIVNIIYGQGKFDQNTLKSISQVFGNLSFTIPLSVFESFIFQIFISFNGLKAVSIYTFANNLGLLFFNFISLLYFGLSGFAYSMVIMYFLMAIFLVLYVNKKYYFIKLEHKFLQYLMLLSLSSLLLWVTSEITALFNLNVPILSLLISILFFLFFYSVLIYLINIDNKVRPFIYHYLTNKFYNR